MYVSTDSNMLSSQTWSSVVCVSLMFCCSLHTSFSFLLNDPKVSCPNPASNCLNETYNRVFENLGCLGCQTGCQPGYVMTANPRYFVTGNDTAGVYTYQGLSIPRSKNVSEPQWLCTAGTTCPFGYFRSQLGTINSCACTSLDFCVTVKYCGEGCMECQSFDNCDTCLLGYWLTTNTPTSSIRSSTCTNSGVLCPEPQGGWHCKHSVYVRAVVGCSGCVLCEDGYLPTSNPYYHRTSATVTSTYTYLGLPVSGSVDIYQGRYICVKGDTCQTGWVNVTRNGVQLCEADATIVG